MEASHKNLKAIRFQGELLPSWAQLLDLASRLCLASEDARRWFTLLTTRAGVEDSREVVQHCQWLRECIQERREFLATELRRTRDDAQPLQILGAWWYALDTMIQAAQSSPTCSWTVEGSDGEGVDEWDGGDITLRRV